MASRKVRMGTVGETSFSTSKYSVVGLRPIKERGKRSEAMVEEQMLFIKETQRAMQKTFENFEKALTENDQQKSEEELERLFKRSEELLVIVQVLVKIRNELAYGRLDLERAIKANNRVDAAKKRVKWLQERLEKVLLTAKTCCHLYSQCHPTMKSNTPEFKEQISERLWNRLPAGQQKFLLESKNKRSIETRDERTYATPIVKEIEKMVSKPESLDFVSEGKKDILQSVEGTEIIQENTMATCTSTKGEDPPINRSTSPKRKQRRRSDNSARGGLNKSDPNNLGVVLPGSQVHQSDEESDTTAEPYSDPEDYDDQSSDSILSSVDAPDVEAGVSDLKRTPDIKVSAPLDNDDDNDNDDPSLIGHGKPAQGISLNTCEHLKKEKLVDQVDEYWNSDHHKFEWSGYVQSIDPSSWHALGLVVPESFLSKEKPKFDPDLPWKEKPMKVNSVIDVHKIALDKLLLRLHRMYEAIGQATQATISPIMRDTKIETVMGKLEFETDGARPAVEITNQEETQPGMTNHASHVSLPQIVSPIAAQRSFMSSEMHPVPTPQPAAIRTARRNTQKMYPQHSSAWCDNSAGHYRMPQIVKTKPNVSKRKSLAQPRYLAARKQESGSRIQHISDLDLANKSLWKPSMVMKIVTVLKVFSDLEKEPADTLDHDSPKWRRVETLLGDGGVLSSNPTIAAEAAKTLGQLKCRDKKVIDTLREVIKKQTDARVGYEASKSMILLGTWDPYAVAVIKQSMKTGNKDVVLELLSTMTKARNIAFIDKSTLEFKELVELLILTVKTQCPDLAFHAAVSLGRLCVVEPVSRMYLIKRLPELCSRDKGEALFVLIKQMNCKDKLVVEALLEQLSAAHNWKLRMEAADMLIFIGARDLFKVTSTDYVFDILERLLWDHANKELRSKVAEVLDALGLRDRACQLVTRRLEDPTDEVRARAVISLATLGMKGVKEMKALLDILELDSSGYVRIQVVRAFGHMDWNDPRILRSLREREKGEGTLAMEARKTLAFLSRLPGRISVAE